MPEYTLDDFLPAYGESAEEKRRRAVYRRNAMERRMRVHQQWWGWERVQRPVGQLAEGQAFPTLTDVEQREASKSNFLTDAIHTVAMTTPTLARDRHFNHLLSSLPMAINLFGLLIDPKTPMRVKSPLDSIFAGHVDTPFAPGRRANGLVGVLVGHPVEVFRIDFEIPGRLHLRSAQERPLKDGTSADVLIEFRDEVGLGVIVIETKLTEALSNGADLMDAKRNYASHFNSPSSPFVGRMSRCLRSELEANKLVQWTRNHLLAFALVVFGGLTAGLYRAGAKLVWRVEHADGLQGFNVYRSAAGGMVQLNNTLLGSALREYVDEKLVPGATYTYQVGAVDADGEFLSPPSKVSMPVRPLALFPNSPNPFSARTDVSFYLPQGDRVELAIYDVAGRRVRTLVGRQMEWGTHTVSWDGRDASGQSVPSGVYFSRLSVGGRVLSSRIVLTR